MVKHIGFYVYHRSMVPRNSVRICFPNLIPGTGVRLPDENSGKSVRSLVVLSMLAIALPNGIYCVRAFPLVFSAPAVAKSSIFSRRCARSLRRTFLMACPAQQIEPFQARRQADTPTN